MKFVAMDIQTICPKQRRQHFPCHTFPTTNKLKQITLSWPSFVKLVKYIWILYNKTQESVLLKQIENNPGEINLSSQFSTKFNILSINQDLDLESKHFSTCIQAF